MTDRIFNFSAGPAVLPEPVLQKAQEAIWNVAGSGIGIMEHSHRGKVFDRIINEAEQACRELAGIPDNYQVLFLQGGASLQFSMVPMNLLPADRTADYLVTGVWSQKAVKEAKHAGQGAHRRPRARPPTSTGSPSRTRSATPPTRPTSISPPTTRSTAPSGPASPRCPRACRSIADTSSDMYSRPIDVRKYGLIYAGAQKNLGPSGVVLVIIRNDLVEAGPKNLPTMLQYRTHVGGEVALQHAAHVRDLRDGRGVQVDPGAGRARGDGASTTRPRPRCCTTTSTRAISFEPPRNPDSRSLMNVCFRAPTEELEEKFVAGSRQARDSMGSRATGRPAGCAPASTTPAPGVGRGPGGVHEGVRASQSGAAATRSLSRHVARLATAVSCFSRALAASQRPDSPVRHASWTSPSFRWIGSGRSRDRRWWSAATGSSRSVRASRVKVPAGGSASGRPGQVPDPGPGRDARAHPGRRQAPDSVVERTLFLYVSGGITTIRGMLGHPRHLESSGSRRPRRAAQPHDLHLRAFAQRQQRAHAGSGSRESWPSRRTQDTTSSRSIPASAGEVFDTLGGDGASGSASALRATYRCEVGLARALETGYATIDHLDGYVEAMVRDGSPVTAAAVGVLRAQPRRVPGRVEAAGPGRRPPKRRGVWNVPTQVLMENLIVGGTAEALARRPEMRYVAPATAGAVGRRRRARCWRRPARRAESARRTIEVRRKLIKALHAGGAGLLLGSDAPQIYNVPGFSTHRELESLVAAGLTPYQALETGHPERRGLLRHAEATRGRSSRGKRADLILLDADPLDGRPANTTRRSGVMLRGRWLPQAEIEKRLAGIAKVGGERAPPSPRSIALIRLQRSSLGSRFRSVSRSFIALIGVIPAKRWRRVRDAASASSESSSSSRRVALATRSMAGKIRRSASSRLSTSSLLPVPLNSSKITWSILLPVSTSAVAMMVSEPPPCDGSILPRAAEKALRLLQRLGVESARERPAGALLDRVVGPGQPGERIHDQHHVLAHLHPAPGPLQRQLRHRHVLRCAGLSKLEAITSPTPAASISKTSSGRSSTSRMKQVGRGIVGADALRRWPGAPSSFRPWPAPRSALAGPCRAGESRSMTRLVIVGLAPGVADRPPAGAARWDGSRRGWLNSGRLSEIRRGAAVDRGQLFERRRPVPCRPGASRPRSRHRCGARTGG